MNARPTALIIGAGIAGLAAAGVPMALLSAQLATQRVLQETGTRPGGHG